MYKINCSYCGEESIFENLSDRPKSCTNCLQPLEELEVQQISESEIVQSETQKTEEEKQSTGLTLICQKTNEKINIEHVEKVILGRESFGSEVLKVPQISGIHCLIEFTDNQYKITDLDSRNGTFAGISKIDCKKNPQQILNNGDLVFLGREPFLIQINFQPEVTEKEDGSSISEEESTTRPEPGKNKIVVFRCLNCGNEYDTKEEICKGCGLSGQWEEIKK